MLYPKDAVQLKLELQQLFSEVEGYPLKGDLKALLVPHGPSSWAVAVQGYIYLHNAHFSKVILLGNQHYVQFQGAVTSDDKFETPLGVISTVPVLGTELNNVAHAKEYSIEAQLPLLQHLLPNITLYPLLVGIVNEQKLVELLNPLLDENTFLIISSDLSQHQEYGKAIMIDNQTIGKILQGDALDLDVCAQGAVKTLLMIAKDRGWKAQLLDYRNSGDLGGDKQQVIGYAAIGFTA